MGSISVGQASKSIDAIALLEGAPLRRLVASSRVSLVRAGATVVAEGDRADAVFGIVRGRLRVTHEHADGRRSWFSILGAGELCGELGALVGATRAAEVTALEESTVLRIPAEVFVAAFESSPRASLALARSLAERLRMLGEHVRQLTALGAEERVAHKLLFLVERFGVRDGAAVAIDLRLTQQDLAELCELSRQRINRVLRELGSIGIEHRRGRVVVRDVAALRRRVRG